MVVTIKTQGWMDFEEIVENFLFFAVIFKIKNLDLHFRIKFTPITLESHNGK